MVSPPNAVLTRLLQTKDYRTWLAEFKRLLAPGGLLITYDIEMMVHMRDGSDPRVHMPVVLSYIDCMNASLHAQGIGIEHLPHVGTWLREMGGFEDIGATVTSLPLGDWDPDWLQQEIGTLLRDNMMATLYSVHPLFCREGKTAEEVDRLVQTARAELYSPSLQCFGRMFYVTARRQADS